MSKLRVDPGVHRLQTDREGDMGCAGPMHTRKGTPGCTGFTQTGYRAEALGFAYFGHYMRVEPYYM